MLRALALLVLVWALGFAAFMLSLGRPVAGMRTDAIVVPTGGPGRIDRGIALMRRGMARRMLVTGVDPDVRPHELAKAYDAPVALFDCCIDLGQEAVDTRSNAVETAAWVAANRVRSVRLVTADWHMARARMELHAALGPGVEILGDPVPTQPRLSMLFSEYHKFLIRRVALWLGVGP